MKVVLVGGSATGKDRSDPTNRFSSPETGERYIVKRYESEKVDDVESWQHSRITLKPLNPEF